MPFRPEHSLLRVEVPALHTIDTSSVENLFGMWSLFSKASNAMEDGKRLENLSWRVWNRETFCCQPRHISSRAARLRKQSNAGGAKCVAAAASPSAAAAATATVTIHNIPVPELSSSLDSASSAEIDDEISGDETSTDGSTTSSDGDFPDARPELRNRLTKDDRRAYERHITPTALENMVISIKESQSIEPIDLPVPTVKVSDTAQEQESDNTATPHLSSSRATLLESSASTVATTNSTESSQSVESEVSSSTEMSGHSVIRGFVPGGAPSSYRSQTNLAATAAQPTPILKTSSKLHSQPAAKKKGAMFTIGTSSGEDESSLDSHMRMPSMPKSELSESLKQGGVLRKTTSFKDEISISRAVARHSPVFESDDEDEEVSESAIEDDDDSSEWEDSDEGHSGPSSIDGNLFQRVDSRPNLTSRRSLLTTLMHEPDRAKALANAASRSTPAMRRSRVTSPNGPSLATTPESTAGMQMASIDSGSRPQPIIIATPSNSQQLALSPRTTRRNMLSTELTESLRKNLLWERQHKSTGNLAALKRRHTSQDVKNLREHPQPTYPTKTGTNMSFTNEYFNAGLGEYHTRGW